MAYRFLHSVILSGLFSTALTAASPAATLVTPLDPSAYGMKIEGRTHASNCAFRSFCNDDFYADIVNTELPGTRSAVNGSDAYTTYAVRAAPKIVASAWATGPASGDASAASFWQAIASAAISLSFFLRVDAPAAASGTDVQVGLIAQGAVEANGGPTNVSYATARAGLTILQQGGLDEALRFSEDVRYDYYTRDEGAQSAAFDLSGPISLLADKIYRVNMTVSTYATHVANEGTFSNGPYYSDAWLDPYFTLSEDLIAQGYGFSFSETFVNSPEVPEEPGPAPVPLPAGAPLLVAGLAALAMLRRRRT